MRVRVRVKVRVRVQMPKPAHRFSARRYASLPAVLPPCAAPSSEPV